MTICKPINIFLHENKPNSILFKFDFNGMPTSDLEVKYRVGFDYDYSYEVVEQK
jgi:hypothetical protein